ncbi:hypothetical protein [Marinobacter sp. CHS3-4]|uniref:hypothetical protein n=1 Tax=Marinobacter sp. CHS3-4 TaxID=3045174 RepID=UPI0024B60CFF|nr:hypothetical protein [Marinobacter sp. CHS3-4]MDI9243854.1 hypothetical protein [Marinobacter sp. CHS3-4]
MKSTSAFLVMAIQFFVVSSSYGHSKEDVEFTKKEISELLEVYQTHMATQLRQMNEFVGDDAITNLSMFNHLIEATEAKDRPLEQVRSMLVLLLKHSVEDVENICELKPFEPSQNRCYRILKKAHENIEEHSGYQ